MTYLEGARQKRSGRLQAYDVTGSAARPASFTSIGFGELEKFFAVEKA